jgi:peptidoglycan/LPS O-acetylase OafA/YrhL
VPASYSLTTLFLNVAFLQTIIAPTFGTNGPLWSLANEFWYYVIFPLALLTFDANQRPVYRAICCALVVGLLAWLPMGILGGGLIWLFGFFAAYLTRGIQWSRRRKHLAICVLFGIFLVALFANRFEPTDWGDIAIGVSFAALLIPAARASLWSSLVRRAATLLADMSYTLYLVHFPILTFIVATLGIPRMVAGLWSVALYAALLVGVLCMSSLVYLMFERHTPALQRWLLKRFTAPQRSSGMNFRAVQRANMLGSGRARE